MKTNRTTIISASLLIALAAAALFFTFAVIIGPEFNECEIGEPVHIDIGQNIFPQLDFDGENVYSAARALLNRLIVKRYNYRNMREPLDTILINNPQGAFAGANIRASYGRPRIKVNVSKEVYLCWTEKNQNRQHGIFFNSLSISGGHLTKNLADNALVYVTNEDIYDIKIFNWDNFVYILWATKVNDVISIYISVSTDCGYTWPIEPIQVCSFNHSGNLSDIYDIYITACEGSNVYAVYQTDEQICLAVSDNNGLNWRTEIIYEKSQDEGYDFCRQCPSLFAGWSNVYILWELRNQEHYFPKKLYLYVSGPNGIRQNVIGDNREDERYGYFLDFEICGRDSLYILFQAVNKNLYIKQSFDNGTTWSDPVSVNSGESQPDYFGSGNCSMSFSDGQILYVVWKDVRRGIVEVPWSPGYPLPIGDIYGAFKKSNWNSFSAEFRLDEGTDIGDNIAMAGFPIITSIGNIAFVSWDSCFLQELPQEGGPYYTCTNYFIVNADAARIEGRVYDSEDNTPIPEAVISLGEWSVTADENGRYAISVPPGTYIIRAEKDGYHPNESPEQEIREYLEYNIPLDEINIPPQFYQPRLDVDIYEGRTTAIGPYDAIDTNGDTLTYSAEGMPAFITYDPASRIFTCTPGYEHAGTYIINYTATEEGEGGLTGAMELVINVLNTNRLPELGTIQNQIINERETLQLYLTASDPDREDTVRFAMVNAPQGAILNSSTGAFSWTTDYNSAGTYHVTFYAYDGDSIFQRGNDSQTVTLTVNNVPQAPVLAPIGNKTVNEGQLLPIILSATDVDGNTLTYSASNLPSGAGFNPANRTFTWTPDYNQAGTYNVTFMVNDGTGGSDSETITITVNNMNQAPVLAAIGNKTVNEGQQLSFTLNAADADGNTLTYSASNLPSGAGFNPANRTFTWTPGYNQAGSYNNVTFAVSDGSAQDTETITITVNNVNQPPVILPIDNKEIYIEEMLEFGITAVDPDGDRLTYSLVNPPQGAVINQSGLFSWRPGADQSGSYVIRIRVSDGQLDTAGEFNVEVLPAVPQPAWTIIDFEEESYRVGKEVISKNFTTRVGGRDYKIGTRDWFGGWRQWGVGNTSAKIVNAALPPNNPNNKALNVNVTSRDACMLEYVFDEPIEILGVSFDAKFNQVTRGRKILEFYLMENINNQPFAPYIMYRLELVNDKITIQFMGGVQVIAEAAINPPDGFYNFKIANINYEDCTCDIFINNNFVVQTRFPDSGIRTTRRLAWLVYTKGSIIDNIDILCIPPPGVSGKEPGSPVTPVGPETPEEPGEQQIVIKAKVGKLVLIGDNYNYEPVPNVSVLFRHQESGEEITGITGENGEVLLALPRTGKYYAHASKEGWTETEIEITTPEPPANIERLFVLEELRLDTGIKGYIMGNSRVAGARVAIVNLDPEPEWLELTSPYPTNQTGFFFIQHPPGIYGIRVTAPGFNEWNGEVEIRDRGFTSYNILLTREEGPAPELPTVRGNIHFPVGCTIGRELDPLVTYALIRFINKETGIIYRTKPLFSAFGSHYVIHVPSGEYIVDVISAKKYQLNHRVFEVVIHEGGLAPLNIFMDPFSIMTGIRGYVHEIGNQDKKIADATVTGTGITDGSVYHVELGIGTPGSYKLELPPGQYTIDVSAIGYQGWQSIVEIPQPPEGDDNPAFIMYNIGLIKEGEEYIPQGVVSGKVYLEGNPDIKITAAQIVFENLENTYRTVSLDTSADSNYSISVPVGRYNITASARNYRDTRLEITVTDAGINPLNIAIARAQVLQGTGAKGMVYKQGTREPVAGATVKYTNTRTRLIKTEEADNSGIYFLEIPSGNYNILAKALGYRDKEIMNFRIPGGRVTQSDIEMQWAGIPPIDAEVSGMVCGGEGNLSGVEGAHLKFTYELDGSQYSAISKRNGVYKVYLPYGTHIMRCSALGYKSKEFRINTRRGVYYIHLEREEQQAQGTGAFGVIYEEGGCTDIPNAVIQFRNTGTDAVTAVNSNETGEYRIELAAGTHRISTTANGYENKEDICYLNPDVFARQNIAMKRIIPREGPGARGIVTEDQTGMRISNVSMRFTRTGGQYRARTEFTARSDENGAYEAKFEEPGRYRVVAAKSGYDNFEISEINIGPDEFTEINIVMRRRRGR